MPFPFQALFTFNSVSGNALHLFMLSSESRLLSVGREYDNWMRINFTHAKNVGTTSGIPSPSIYQLIRNSISIALWNRKKEVVTILGALCLAHWTLLYRTMVIVVAEWNSEAHTCVVVQTSPKLLNTVFFFSKPSSSDLDVE